MEWIQENKDAALRNMAILKAKNEEQSQKLPTNSPQIDEKKRKSLILLYFNGAPERTRTSNPRLRRPMLYPVELQAHKKQIF